MNESDNKNSTHFGYQSVPANEKAHRVAEVFHSVADRYDLMNDLMSFGVHRLWKRFTVNLAAARSGERVLDLAGGTGDLAERFAQQVGPEGEVVLADINASMLRHGRDRLTDAGVVGNLRYAQVDAEALPFPENSFNLITIAFGLRNVTDKSAALRSMYRVLKPGGRLLVLEFSKPVLPGLGKVYDAYSFTALPIMGRVVTGDSASYRYLAESIRMHPDQQRLRDMMESAGFERIQFYNLTGGIVAVHRGYKF
ncbi:bifunctional demethylmenaquinone methyltransferase/2-methoxy-6-polyprenyl-1,4-benzoquinol methylase UbiE [Acidihalobacter prosperus]